MATRWGICGAGLISTDFVSSVQLLPADEHSVVAVATRDDLVKAQNFATKFGIEAAFGSYKELAQHAGIGNNNVVVLCTLQFYHENACYYFFFVA